jgi:FkbM family methyltransferase
VPAPSDDYVRLAGVLRRLGAVLPTPLVAALNRAQFRHQWAAKPLGYLQKRVARGACVVARGPGKGLRIDATGRNAGYVLGTSDRDEQVWLAEHLRSGDVFYDVGANVGFFTLIGARLVTPRGTVVAFEPLPTNLSQLEKNVELNSFKHVLVVPAAVGAATGTSSFGSPSGRRDNARLLPERGQAPSVVEVRVTSIDDWRWETRARPPSVMKIDVEGAEIDVLRGAKATIRDHRPIMLVEVHWLGQSFLDYVDEAILPLGYSATTIERHPLPTRPVRCHVILTPSEQPRGT